MEQRDDKAHNTPFNACGITVAFVSLCHCFFPARSFLLLHPLLKKKKYKRFQYTVVNYYITALIKFLETLHSMMSMPRGTYPVLKWIHVPVKLTYPHFTHMKYSSSLASWHTWLINVLKAHLTLIFLSYEMTMASIIPRFYFIESDTLCDGRLPRP